MLFLHGYSSLFHRWLIDVSSMNYWWLVDGTSLAWMRKNIGNMDETLIKHQRFINVNDVRCRIDASLMWLMTTITNHQCYQCILDWGRQNLSLLTPWNGGYNKWAAKYYVAGVNSFIGSFLTYFDYSESAKPFVVSVMISKEKNLPSC